MAALKRLLRYLRGTSHRGLEYSFSSVPPAGVHGFFDAAFADDVDTRRSTMEYVFFHGTCPISWSSKLHTYVTDSTNHAEYVAAAKAAKEARWLIKVYQALEQPTITPISLYGDNEGSVAMTKNPVKHSACKHVEIHDHYAREQVERGFITITHVPSHENTADLFTKALMRAKFETHVSTLMPLGPR